MDSAYREAVVSAVRQLGVGIFRNARQGRERHLQPHHVFTWFQYIAHPVRRPGVVEDRFTFFKTGNGVGHHRRVVTLIMIDGFVQVVSFQLVVDGRFTAPAWRTAGQVGFTVTVGVEQFGDLRIFQLRNVGDVVLIGGFLIDQITLCRAANQRPFTIELLITARRGVHVVMQRDPVDGGERRIAGGDRGVADVVIDFVRFTDGVAQFFQRAAHQQRLEGLFWQGALHRLNGNAFPWKVGSKRAGGDQRGKSSG